MPPVDCFVIPSLFFVPSLDMDSLVMPSFCMPPLVMLSWARAARDAASAKAAATITDAILDIGGLLVRGFTIAGETARVSVDGVVTLTRRVRRSRCLRGIDFITSISPPRKAHFIYSSLI
jgi:hypothetical protein